MVPWGAILGVGGSIFGASAAKKAAAESAAAIRYAADKEDARVRELTAPSVEAQKYALPALQKTIQTQLAPEVGTENPYLKTGHKQNLVDIERGRNQALAKSKMFWGKAGGSGQAREEALNIDIGTTEATNRENLGYGTAQQGYKDNKLMSFMSALQGLAGTGSSGVNQAVAGAGSVANAYDAAASTEAAGKTGFAQDIASLGGLGLNDWMNSREYKRLEKILGKTSAKVAA